MMLLRGTGLAGMYAPAGVDDEDEWATDTCINCGDEYKRQPWRHRGLCHKCEAYEKAHGRRRPPVSGYLYLQGYPEIRIAPGDCECGEEPVAAVQWRVGQSPRLLWLCSVCFLWWQETEPDLDYKTTYVVELRLR